MVQRLAQRRWKKLGREGEREKGGGEETRKNFDPAERLLHHHAPKTSRVASRCHATAHECKRRLSALLLLVSYRHELEKASNSVCLFVACVCVCVCACVCKQWRWTAEFSRQEKRAESWLKGRNKVSLFSYQASVPAHG